MSDMIKFSEDSKLKILSGVKTLVDAVKITLGPKGRNVMLDRGYGNNVITNDGATIAENVKSEDRFEQLIIDVVKEVAIKTNSIAGDGTTTATVLMGKMIEEGIKAVNNKMSPLKIKKGMNIATEIALSKIDKCSQKVKGKDEIKKIASISAGDEDIGGLIADAMEKVGNNGIITVEESQKMSLDLELTNGIKIDRGFLSSYMATDVEKMESLLEEPYILITDKKINVIQEILPILEQIIDTGKPLYVIAEDVSNEVLSTLVVNKMRGIFNCTIVKAPLFGDRRKEILKDIALCTNTFVASEENGVEIKDVKKEELGRAKSIKITKDKSIIMEGNGDREQINKRIESIKKRMDNEKDEYEREILKERISILTGLAAVIKVGAYTETEMREKKFRIEDALSATAAANEEGIVDGGGITYLKTLNKLNEKYISTNDEDEKMGIKIVIDALKEPIRQIVINSGKDGNIVLEKILENNCDIGYDAINDKYVDMKEAGIIDPVKVAKSALQNANSISAAILTTEVIILSKNDEKENINY